MTHVLRRVLLAVSLGGAALTFSGCCGKANTSATTACASSPTSGACQACCKSATGKSSYAFVSGRGCKCY